MYIISIILVKNYFDGFFFSRYLNVCVYSIKLISKVFIILIIKSHLTQIITLLIIIRWIKMSDLWLKKFKWIIITNCFFFVFFLWHNTASQIFLTPSGQVAVRLSSSRCQILSPQRTRLGSQWISLSFHHSLMSSCSCQHLLTAGNSSLHTGSWDPRDELQSAIRRGGCTSSWANQGKHPFKEEGVGAGRQIEPKLPP